MPEYPPDLAQRPYTEQETRLEVMTGVDRDALMLAFNNVTYHAPAGISFADLSYEAQDNATSDTVLDSDNEDMDEDGNTCDRCSAFAADDSYTCYDEDSTSIDLCYRCANFQYRVCHGPTCYNRIHPDLTSCPVCDEERECLCTDCRQQRGEEIDEFDSDADGEDSGGLIHSYSYRPDLVFRGGGGRTGTDRAGRDRALYLGFELEVSTYGANTREAAELVTETFAPCAGRRRELGFLKADGSINRGFEIVTHPMTYEWANEHFPWDMLDRLHAIGVRGDESCGMHVHASRAGFRNENHIYRWMKFFYRNQLPVEQIARRKSHQWASFREGHREQIKRFSKGEKYGAERYSAINVQNDETFEVRVFASAVNKVQVRAALGLVAASIEYTRHLTAQQILKENGWGWPAFYKWVKSNDIYAPLAAEMERVTCVS